jgi:serine/threonine-protein kinase
MRADIQRALAGRPVHATPIMRTEDGPVVGSVPPTTVIMREPPQRKRGLAYALLAVATLAVFVVALVAARSLLGNSAADLYTPNVVHQSLADARSTLTSQGLTVGTITRHYTGQDNVDEVLAQNPPAGILLHKGQAVDLVVSNGIRMVTVPTGLIGQTVDGATAALTAANLQVGQIVPRNSAAPAGQVLGSQPPAGSPLAAGSKVTLIVSNAHVKVPNVIGKDQATASAILLEAAFNPVIQKSAVYVPGQDGTVISQTPTGDTYASTGSNVVIYIDVAPPSPTSTPTSPTSTPTSPTSTGTSTATSPPPTP